MTTIATTERTLQPRMSHKEAADILRVIQGNFTDGIREAIEVAITTLAPNLTPTLDNIIAAVARETGVTEDEMLMRCRHREYAEARYMVFYLAHYYTSTTLTAMARRLERADHVIVIYGIKKGDEWMVHPQLNPLWVERVKRIINSIEQ